jgi:SAM-dependent methyltransferase
MTHKNLECYNNYEIFLDDLSENEYRKSKLISSNEHVSFINKIFNSKKINVVELGSGNSKTLYNLSLNNLLEKGYGFEISNSRYSFAEKWKSDLKISNVTNINDNFLNIKNYNITNIDLCISVDLSFQFCEPIESGSEKKLLDNIYSILNPGGKLIIELDGCGQMVKSSKTNNKSWQEFYEPDPWQFSLWEYSFDEETNFLTWNKTFISRNNNKHDYSSVILKIYNKNNFEKLLSKSGFKNIKFYQNSNFDNLNNDGLEFIVVAEK